MLTEYQFSNFKAFKGPVRIPIKPITLIFGPNSSGKSSILQSLLMLKQTIDQGQYRDVLLSKGNLVDLGSYKDFIHQHDIEREFSVRFSFNAPQLSELNKIVYWDEDAIGEGFKKLIQTLQAKTIGIEVVLPYDKNKSSIYTHMVKLYIGKENDPIIMHEVHSAKELYTDLRLANPMHMYWKTYWETFDKENMSFHEATTCYMNRSKNVEIDFKNFLPWKVLFHTLEEHILSNRGQLDDIGTHIDLIILVLSKQIERFLNNTKYVPPLRPHSPSHEIAYKLYRDKERINRLNAAFRNLNIGYEFKIYQLSDKDSEIDDIYVMKLRDISTGVLVNISDVGFGVSQILPIITNSLVSQEQTIFIEQPELHLHPALQAELGDLFIRSALGDQKNHFLIETHSEHLILRLLRRIRENSDGELPSDIPSITPDDVAVLYVQPFKDGAKVINIPVTESGRFEIAWPQGFFAERSKELF